MYEIKIVNQNGLNFIRDILDMYHVNPQRACEKEYAKEVEFALAEGCGPILEISALNCVNGCTSSWVLSETDLDSVSFEFED